MLQALDSQREGIPHLEVDLAEVDLAFPAELCPQDPVVRGLEPRGSQEETPLQEVTPAVDRPSAQSTIPPQLVVRRIDPSVA